MAELHPTQHHVVAVLGITRTQSNLIRAFALLGSNLTVEGCSSCIVAVGIVRNVCEVMIDDI